MKTQLKALLMLLLAIAGGRAYGQDFAVKSNLLYDATATINVGAEVGLAPRWTFDLSGNLNAWKFSEDRRWKHWMLQPEARYWFCDRFAGHFVAAHALGGQYNVGGIKHGINFLGNNLKQLADYRYQGWFVGVGVGYGYSWILGRHWSLEAELGVGYIYTQFDKFQCAGCGKKIENDVPHHYVGPTKAAIDLIYVF